VLRDVGRVLEMPYGQVDRLCKLVPNNPANPTPLGKAIEGEPKFEEEKQKEPIVGQLLDMALKLEGLYRHASTHAAGIVIGDRPLSQLVPMYRDPRSDMPVTQFNMKWVEQAGLVKFDFLGLKTLTVLKTAVDLISRGAGSRSISPTCRSTTADLRDAVARRDRRRVPGGIGGHAQGADRHEAGPHRGHHRAGGALPSGSDGEHPDLQRPQAWRGGAASIHPKIDHLVKETQGVIVYQEQVMQIAQELAGYTLGQADLLRRAMGKKIRAEMEKQRGIFVEGATERGVAKQQADFIFDLLAKFADYGFNKSHAAAYAIVSYQTGLSEGALPGRVPRRVDDLRHGQCRQAERFPPRCHAARHRGLPPSVQTSYRPFEVGENTIFYALAAIKGVGEAAVDHIVERRGDKPFESLEDFANRIDTRIVNRRTLEGLIAAGALDCFGHDRAALVAGIDRIMGLSQRAVEQAESGQGDIFGALSAVEPERLHLPHADPWTSSGKADARVPGARLLFLRPSAGRLPAVLEKMRVQQYADFALAVKRGAKAGRLAGTVASKQVRRTRTGNKMGIFVLSDATGQFEV
jgi:DNA polymerase-3 subunit alpha